MEFNFNSYDNSKQSISYCEVDKCKAVIKLKKCLQEIKEIAQYDTYTPHTDLCIKLNWVKKKISEVGNEEN